MTEEDAREQNRSKKIRIHFGSSYKPDEAASPQLDFAIALSKARTAALLMRAYHHMSRVLSSECFLRALPCGTLQTRL